jgi:hypothetical protein
MVQKGSYTASLFGNYIQDFSVQNPFRSGKSQHHCHCPKSFIMRYLEITIMVTGEPSFLRTRQYYRPCAGDKQCGHYSYVHEGNMTFPKTICFEVFHPTELRLSSKLAIRTRLTLFTFTFRRLDEIHELNDT